MAKSAGIRTERLDVLAGRYADPPEIIELAKAKIRSLGDEPIEVEINGKRPFDKQRTTFFIKCKVRPR